MKSKLKALTRRILDSSWEHIPRKHVISFRGQPQPHFPFLREQPPGVNRLSIKRDSQYQLQATLIGQGRYEDVTRFYHALDETWNQALAGSVLKSEVIKFHNFASEYQITGHYFLASSLPQLVAETGNLKNDIVKYELRCPINSVTITFPSIPVCKEQGRSRLTEWCINAPKMLVGYQMRSIQHEDTLSVVERYENDDMHVLSSDFHSSGVNGFRFRYRQFTVCVKFIAIEDIISFSRKLAIQYDSSDGSTPSSDQRKIVIEFISFIFGRPVMAVGHTIYRFSGTQQQEVAHHSQSPGADIVSAAEIPSYAPLSFEPSLIRDDDENITLEPSVTTIEQFTENYIPRYEELRDKSALRDLLYDLWQAQPLPCTDRIAIYTTALERASKIYLEDRKISIHYMPVDDARTLRKTVRRVTRTCLEKLGRPQEEISYIEKKLGNFNEVSIKVRLERFLSEIGITMTKREWDAIKLRHSAVHGGLSASSSRTDSEEQNETLVEYAFRTLLHRVFLHLIGYPGRYIDYGTLGFPSQDTRE